MVVVTPLTAIMVMNLIRIKLYERHPHTSGLHKSKYCVMPDPFPAERFGKGSGYARLLLTTNESGTKIIQNHRQYFTIQV